MTTFGEIELSTTGKELWDALFDLRLDGVEVAHKLEKSFKGEQLVRKVIVHFLWPVSVGYFANWLYEHHGHHGESQTQIEGKHIPKECLEINNVIMQQVTVNNSCRIKQPENEAVPEE